MSNEETNNSGHINLKITNVDNAAFIDFGLESEISRMVDLVASKIEFVDEPNDIDFVLRDTNGNTVGHINYFPIDDDHEDDPETVISLSIELGNEAFDNCVGAETARILREAASKVMDGVRHFGLYDINGNNVGNFEWKNAK